jgi:hypothetical protein
MTNCPTDPMVSVVTRSAYMPSYPDPDPDPDPDPVFSDSYSNTNTALPQQPMLKE